MSNMRFNAVMGLAATALAATLFLETKTDTVSSFRESVGAQEYSIADARRAVSAYAGHDAEVQALMAVAPSDTLAAHLPKPLFGWNVEAFEDLAVPSLTAFGRSFSDGIRPSPSAIWPAGTMMVNGRGRLVLDNERVDQIYSGTRDAAGAVYDNGIGKLLISLERLPVHVAEFARLSDLEAVETLERETFQVNGRTFYVLTEPGAGQVLVRGYMDDGIILDVRGRGYVSEIVELIEAIDLTNATEA